MNCEVSLLIREMSHYWLSVAIQHLNCVLYAQRLSWQWARIISYASQPWVHKN